MQRIDIHQDFPIPVEKLFAYLGEHENLEVIFHPTKIRRIADGQGARNGVGSAREMRALGGPAFVETVTAYRENELIEYRITRGSPLKTDSWLRQQLQYDLWHARQAPEPDVQAATFRRP